MLFVTPSVWYCFVLDWEVRLSKTLCKPVLHFFSFKFHTHSHTCTRTHATTHTHTPLSTTQTHARTPIPTPTGTHAHPHSQQPTYHTHPPGSGPTPTEPNRAINRPINTPTWPETPERTQDLRRFRICGQIRAGYPQTRVTNRNRISGRDHQVGNPGRPDRTDPSRYLRAKCWSWKHKLGSSTVLYIEHEVQWLNVLVLWNANGEMRFLVIINCTPR